MAKQQIVIFGGAFSPPTLAHEAIMAALLGLPQFDEVWIMPSGDRLDKDMTAQDRDRLAMLRLVHTQGFKDEPRLKITDFELRMPRPSQTYRTILALAQAFPGPDFWFAFGPDSYASMPTWPHGAALQKRLKGVLCSSQGATVPVVGETILLQISSDYDDTSSTEARRLTALNKPLESLVSQTVADYIVKHQLYNQVH